MSVFEKSSRLLPIALACCLSLLLVLPQLCAAKTLDKVVLSTEGASTGLPDLFSGIMSYSIPIEVPAGRKGMDPGLALNYRSGSGNGVLGVGWELELGSIQRATTGGTVNFSGDSYLLTKTGSAFSLFSVGTNSYQTKIEGGFSKVQQISTVNGPYWVVTDKAGMRFYYGQTAASRQDDSGSISRIFKWNLDRIEDTNGNYIAIYYYKNQNQIYLDRIAYTGSTGLDPTNFVNFYWESRTDLNPVSTPGFTVNTAYRLATIDIGTKLTSTSSSRARTYKLTYDANPALAGSQYSSSTGARSLLYSVQQYDKNCQVPTKTAINSSGQITGATALPAKTMIYDQTSGSLTADYLTSFSNGIGGTTTVSYTAAILSGTTETAQNVSSVAVNDGNEKISTTYYQYTGGYYYAAEKDFRGFNKVEVWGPVSDDGKQIRAETYYHQGNDTALDANNPAVPTGFTKGKPYRSITYAVSGVTTGNEATVTSQKISETTTIYAPISLSAPFYTPPMQIDSYLYDGDTSYKQSRTIFTYDTYGNVIKEEIQGDVNDSAYDRTVDRTFSPNVTGWIVGLPATEEIYQGIGSSIKVSGKTLYYDDLIACDGSATNNQTPVKGNLTRVVSWLDGGTSPEVRMAYDSYGNIACRRDAKGNTTTIGYDAGHTYPVTATSPLGQQTLTQYYGVNEQAASGTGLYGQVKSVTDPNGATTAKEYDSLGRPTKVTLPDNTWTSRSYINFGTLGTQYVRIDTSDGLWVENYFDGLGRTYLNKAKGPDSKTIATSTVYDVRGSVKKTSLPYFYGDEPRYLLTDYDAIGRVVRSGMESPADNIRSLTCYDKDVTVKIDPNNHRRREVRDPAGHLIKVQEYSGTFSDCSTEEGSPYATTTYQYDVLGNLRFVTDAKGNQTEMRYDTLGRKRYMHDPDMGVWGYTSDANGNLETQTDAKGQVITFGYDALNRLRTKWNGTSLVLTNYYDEPTSSNSIGRLSRMVDTTGQTIYNYDNMGRATSTVKSIDGTSYTLGFSFLGGRLNSITYPDNETVNYSYDAGVLKGVTGYVSYSNIDALGRPWNVSYSAGGASSLYTFDTDTQRLHTLSVVSPNQGLLIDNNYDYDYKGNITGITDNLDKTLPTTISSETYVLDTSRAHAVGSTGSGRVFQYDGNGNIWNDGQRSISYNYDNMPTAVNSTSFTYDGSSTRVKKSSSGKTTIYISKLYECTNGICTKYIFSGGTRIAAKTGNQISFFHPDHQGSTSVITDATGNEVDDVAYYPFGGTRQDSNATFDSHKYTDQERDSETGLYNYNARLYDPETGRFMTPDAIVPDPTNPQSLNRYSYVINNPMNYTDPTGHSFRKAWKKFKKWWKENVDVDAGVGMTVSGNPGGGTGTVTVNGGSGSANTATNPVNNPSATGITIYANGGFVSANSLSSQLSNSSQNNYGYAQLSLGYLDYEGSLTSSSSFNVANEVRTGTIGGFNGTQFVGSVVKATGTAFSGAGSALGDMAINGPPAARGALGFAALTVVGPVGYAAGPYALSYGLMNPQGVVEFISSQFPGPATPITTVSGLWGVAINTIFPVAK